MRTFAISVCFALLAAACLTSGCGYAYKVQKQDAYEVGPITSSQKIYVRPPVFDKMTPRPEDYENEQDWATDVADIQKEFGEQVTATAESHGLAGRVVPATLTQEVKDGVLVETDVVKFRPEWSAMGGGYDFLTLHVRFLDADSGKKLYESELEVTTKIWGPVGWRANSISGRLAIASWNMLPPVMSIVKTGAISPLQD